MENTPLRSRMYLHMDFPVKRSRLYNNCFDTSQYVLQGAIRCSFHIDFFIWLLICERKAAKPLLRQKLPDSRMR